MWKKSPELPKDYEGGSLMKQVEYFHAPLVLHITKMPDVQKNPSVEISAYK